MTAVIAVGLAALFALGGVKLVRVEAQPATAQSTAQGQDERLSVPVRVVNEDGQPVSDAGITPDGLRMKAEAGSP